MTWGWGEAGVAAIAMYLPIQARIETKLQCSAAETEWEGMTSWEQDFAEAEANEAFLLRRRDDSETSGSDSPFRQVIVTDTAISCYA